MLVLMCKLHNYCTCMHILCIIPSHICALVLLIYYLINVMVIILTLLGVSDPAEDEFIRRARHHQRGFGHTTTRTINSPRLIYPTPTSTKHPSHFQYLHLLPISCDFSG